MESFLIVAKDPKIAQEYAHNLCVEKEIADIDITIIENQNSIGIAEVRNLQKTLFFKPLKSKTKACIISKAHNLTHEAQSALLKLLEEPPNNTIIILSAENKDLLLPTILSRCRVIELKNFVNQSEKSDLSILTENSIGQRLKLAERLSKDKNEAISWLENAILALRQELISGKQHINTIKTLQKTYVTLKTTNANPRLTLENLFLNL